MALQDVFEDLAIIVKIDKPDGMGGTISEWTEIKSFNGSITLDNSIQSRVAEQQGVTNLYTIITFDDVLLEYHNIVERKSDGQIFRVKSLNNKENIQPYGATMQVRTATAENYILPPLNQEV